MTEIFQRDENSPFMLLAVVVTKNKRAVTPGITHVDGTARIQTVTDEDLDRCGRQFEACTRPYEVGDVFLMATGRLGNGDVDHVAVYVGHGRVIQTTERLGVITTEVRAVERMTRMVMRFRQDAVLAG